MSKYRCDQCGYQTNNSHNFTIHVNRKNPCRADKPSQKIKHNKQTHCAECNKNFSREDALKRHLINHHSIKVKNGAVIEGNDNTVINGNHNVTGHHNTVIGTLVIQPIVLKYDCFDLADLTLYEQYLSLTDKNSPYTALLDQLNLNPMKSKYHNMRYGDLHSNSMDVYDGTKWIKSLVTNALSEVVSAERIMIGSIFNRFRIFLNNEATDLIPTAYYYGYRENYWFHKQVVTDVKLHLYNYTRHSSNNNQTTENVPSEDDEVWWALFDNFTWAEVKAYITKMDKYKINFDKPLDNIKCDIETICSNKPKLTLFFQKLLLHIDQIIVSYHQSVTQQEQSKETKRK